MGIGERGRSRKRELEEERGKRKHGRREARREGWREHRQVGIQDKRDPFTNLMGRFLKEGTSNCVQTASL